MNVSNDQRVTEEAAVRAVRAMRASDAASTPKRHSQQTTQCPNVARFAAVLKFHGTWTPEEDAHLRSRCPFCDRVRQMFAAALTEAAQDETVVNISSSSTDETVSGLSPRKKPAKPDAAGDAPKPG